MLIGAGIALVTVAACCFLQSRRVRHRSVLLAGAQLLTCAEVASAGPGRVAVAAATGTEPRLCAPVTGRNCVWYRVAISLQMEQEDEALGPVTNRHQTAAGGIYLQDATGKVPLTRELAARTLTQPGDSPIITTTGFPNSSAARRYVKGLWWSRKIGPQYGLLAPSETRFSYQLTEEILPPGADVFVIGTIRAGEGEGCVLALAGRGDGATTLSRDEAAGQFAAGARRWSAWALCLAAAGLAIILAGILLASLAGRGPRESTKRKSPGSGAVLALTPAHAPALTPAHAPALTPAHAPALTPAHAYVNYGTCQLAIQSGVRCGGPASATRGRGHMAPGL